MKFYIILVLICIALMISDAELFFFFVCLLAISMFSLEKRLFTYSVHFLIWLFFSY